MSFQLPNVLFGKAIDFVIDDDSRAITTPEFIEQVGGRFSMLVVFGIGNVNYFEQ
jgi:hypothetical protein